MKNLKVLFPIMLLISIMGLKLLPNGNRTAESNNSLAIVQQSNFFPIPTNNLEVEYSDLGDMKASWYGPRFHGRLTANGEIYDQNAFTAAHKSLPFGTLLRLTNKKNNKSVIVRINDRGPYIPGRQIDLSKKVAIELGTYKKGVVELKVERISLSGIESPLIN